MVGKSSRGKNKKGSQNASKAAATATLNVTEPMVETNGHSEDKVNDVVEQKVVDANGLPPSAEVEAATANPKIKEGENASSENQESLYMIPHLHAILEKEAARINRWPGTQLACAAYMVIRKVDKRHVQITGSHIDSDNGGHISGLCVAVGILAYEHGKPNVKHYLHYSIEGAGRKDTSATITDGSVHRQSAAPGVHQRKAMINCT